MSNRLSGIVLPTQTSNIVSYIKNNDSILTLQEVLSTLGFKVVSTTMEGRSLDDLIYGFLLQSGYPRAAIVFDMDLLGPTIQIASGMKVPSFIIVDPQTAEPLAVMDVVDALDAEALKQVAIEAGAYASRLGGKSIQGLVIRVDVRGRVEAEQVQFYRVWPNSTLHSLSSKNFPDLEALRISRKLILSTTAKSVESSPALEGPVNENTVLISDNHPSGSDTSQALGLYLPAFCLLLLILVDIVFDTVFDGSFMSLSQSILAAGAAGLLTVPSAIRYLRQ